mmetsp:Transcript_44257/g.142768  ORF Transcript_44257/g.142768 Transcript_44257/m.142768 type:complete len:313 (+) Transcript_44257:287-1225(+)
MALGARRGATRVRVEARPGLVQLRGEALVLLQQPLRVGREPRQRTDKLAQLLGVDGSLEALDRGVLEHVLHQGVARRDGGEVSRSRRRGLVAAEEEEGGRALEAEAARQVVARHVDRCDPHAPLVRPEAGEHLELGQHVHLVPRRVHAQQHVRRGAKRERLERAADQPHHRAQVVERRLLGPERRRQRAGGDRAGPLHHRRVELAVVGAGVGRRGVGSGVCCRDAAIGRHGSGSGVCGQEVEREGVDVVEVGVVGREGGDPCGDWQVVPVPVRVDPAEEGLASHREGNAPQHRAHPRSVRRLQRVGRGGIQQ